MATQRHCPGARSARRRAIVIPSQAAPVKETTMWFRTTIRSQHPRRSMSSVQPSLRRHPTRLRVELLEDRCTPSATVTLAPNDDSPLVGERITWTATATDVGANPVYRFSAAPHGGAFHVVRDFSPPNSFAWTPMQ